MRKPERTTINLIRARAGQVVLFIGLVIENVFKAAAWLVSLPFNVGAFLARLVFSALFVLVGGKVASWAISEYEKEHGE